MASGMHRGLYGRAESPYNLEYLTAAFSSGSSNGSATSTSASFAAFGLGSETVSSGRSPASNNGLIAYTPSRTVISPRGVWPLYPTCDVLVPHTRTVEDMLAILDVLTQTDATTDGDFWRQQSFVEVPEVLRPRSHLDLNYDAEDALRGKRIAVPKMYIGGHDPSAKSTVVYPGVIELWERARKDLEGLGATVVETDFPLVTNYEDDSVSGHTNNVTGFTADWNAKERGELVAYLWDDFLKANGDPSYPSLASIDGSKMFPRPEGYIPDRYMEVKNFINYPSLVEMAKRRNGKSIWDIDGIAQALPALEAQRKRDLDDWMASQGIDLVIFPANGDVGRADLDTNDDSARHALQNGVKYSNGNRALRHMGTPTVSVSMGILPSSKMPVNLTFLGMHGQDSDLLRYALAFEKRTKRRVAPPVTPPLRSDHIVPHLHAFENGSGPAPVISDVSMDVISEKAVRVQGRVVPADGVQVEVIVNGETVASQVDIAGDGRWTIDAHFEPFEPPKPLYGGMGLAVGKVMTIVVARSRHGVTAQMKFTK